MLLRLTQAIYIHYTLVGSLVGMRARYENPPPALGFPHSRASVLRKDEKFTGEERGGGGELAVRVNLNGVSYIFQRASRRRANLDAPGFCLFPEDFALLPAITVFKGV